MNRVFVSFKFTGEEAQELQATIPQVLEALRARGNEVYCTFEDESRFREEEYTQGEILKYALSRIDEADTLFVILTTSDKSEGVPIEFGYALAKGKRIVVAHKTGVTTTFMQEVADECIAFDTIAALCKKLH